MALVTYFAVAVAAACLARAAVALQPFARVGAGLAGSSQLLLLPLLLPLLLLLLLLLLWGVCRGLRLTAAASV